MPQAPSNPRPRPVHALAAGLAALTTLIFSPAPANAEAIEEQATEPKRFLMHYMPWYEAPDTRGRWGEHWTGWQKQHNPDQLNDKGHPDIWSNMNPLIGPYDSSDPDVLECQLLQMKVAGIDGVIADWYGIANTADYPSIHTATKALFEACEELGMSFSICYEDRTVQYMVERDELAADEIADHLTETFRWVEDNWFRSDTYERYNSRPLLLNFGPIFIKDADPWHTALNALDERPAFFPLHHLWKGVNADGGFTWVHAEAINDAKSDADAVEALTRVFRYPADDPKQVIISALPGFDDVYANSFTSVPYNEGRTLRNHLEAAKRSDSPILQLVTWNDYGEATCIEPTHEFGYLFLEIIQEHRAEEFGSSFRFTKDDLRLPARLLELRRAGKAPEARLDRIAELIAAGETRMARTMLNALER